jgi:hypothetical protein
MELQAYQWWMNDYRHLELEDLLDAQAFLSHSFDQSSQRHGDCSRQVPDSARRQLTRSTRSGQATWHRRAHLGEFRGPALFLAGHLGLCGTMGSGHSFWRFREVRPGPDDTEDLVSPRRATRAGLCYQGTSRSQIAGGGRPILARVQGQEHVATIACLVRDGHKVYALTNRHVTGEPGEILYTQ